MFRRAALIVFLQLAVVSYFAEHAAAYYAAEVGRFLTRDPWGYVDKENMYQYVAGSPLEGNDPLGLCTVHVYAGRLGHHGIWISGKSMLGGTGVDGTRHNDVAVQGGLGPPGTIVATFHNLSEEQCGCLRGSQRAWRASPQRQRKRTCAICPRNSNWVLKCLLRRCDMTVTWGWLGTPYGWNSHSDKCLQYDYRYSGSGNCPTRVCVKFQECPDGFGLGAGL